MHPKLWIAPDKQVNRVGHDFSCNDCALGFVANFTDDLLQPSINAVHQDTTAILRAKDNVIFAGGHSIVVGLLNIIVHIGHYTATMCIMQVLFLAGCLHLAWNNVLAVLSQRAIHPHAYRQGLSARFR